MSIVCTFGAPRVSGLRLVVAKRNGVVRVLYNVLAKDVHEQLAVQPWLDDIEARIPDNTVSEIDVYTFYDDETPDDGAKNVLAKVSDVLPLAEDASPEDVWGIHILVDTQREIWVNYSIDSARRKAQRLGLIMSEQALQTAADKARHGYQQRRAQHEAMMRQLQARPAPRAETAESQARAHERFS